MGRSLRMALVGLSLIGLFGVAANYRAWAAEQHRLGSLLELAEAERAVPGLPERVLKANEPLAARTRALRPLVAQFMDPSWLLEIPEDERLEVWERTLAAIDEIEPLSRDLLARRPTSWEAAMIFGANSYLLARGTDMARSISSMERWEVPLRLAEARIPGYAEPTRYLALIYVNHWQSLSAGQREAATLTMTEAFRDPRTFDLAVELWLRYLPDKEDALEVVPDEPHTWQRLERIFERQRDWDLYLESHARLEVARARELDALLDEAEARVAGGDYRRGTVRFHAAAAALEADGSNLARLERILDRMPAGPVSAGAARSLGRWIAWALDLGFVRESPLDSKHLLRLTGTVPDLPLSQRALAVLMSGDLAGAEQIERRWSSVFGEDWDRYLILKAEALTRRLEIAEARRTLLRVRGSWQDHPTYLRVASEVARAAADPQLTILEQRRAALGARSWRGHQMTWVDGVARIDLVPEHRARAISIEFLDAADQGSPVEIRWNGSATGRRIALPGRTFEVELPVEPEASLLEIRSPGQRPFSPGLISLIDSES